ncbi:MAG TPA: BMP family ABC transporter substrate-binding protein [Solirubrobacteraceae bacterium]|nr:BMP family ABC transporter substrate-binding protein [Solirubrobacteraceae bacterium]
MRKRSLAAILFAAFVLSLGLVAAGCGDDEEEPSGGSGTSQEEEKPAIKVGLVTDIGGLNDRSFNQLANEGLERAKSELGIEGRAVTSESDADYVPNLSRLAQEQYDLVIGVGFLMADSINTVAKQFPDTNFAIIDFSQAALEAKPANVRGLLFKENEAGYLVGYLAALVTQEKGGDMVISSVGGQKIPPVDAYIAGYQAAAKKVEGGFETLNAYSQDFVDQAKCKEIALNQIAEGSQVVFQVAGQCGLGALDAAKEKNVLGIGVDADQGYLGEHILTSAQKKVDVAVFETAKAVQDGAFAGGEDQIFSLENDGVALGEVNADGQPFVDQVEEIKQQIIDGEITDIPAEVGK